MLSGLSGAERMGSTRHQAKGASADSFGVIDAYAETIHWWWLQVLLLSGLQS